MADLRYTGFREITIIYWIFTVFLFVMLALFYYLGLTSNTVFNLITALWTSVSFFSRFLGELLVKCVSTY